MLHTTQTLGQTVEPKPARTDLPSIFGLRYLEEEAVEIHDVVGCDGPAPVGDGSFTNFTLSHCTDDFDSD